MREARADVAVVGAGLSGLAAARELEREGLEVLVLEAQNRPGGRTRAEQVRGVTVDLGGEWVDEAHMDLRDLVFDLGLALVPAGGKKAGRWYVRGEWSEEMPFPSSADAKVYARMNEALEEAASSRDLKTFWKDVPPEDDVSLEGWLRREGLSEAGLHAVETLVSTCGSTVPLRRMSFYAYAVKVATRGGFGRGNEYRVRGGAGGVAAKLAEELAGKVRYRSPVVEVRQEEGGRVALRCASAEGPFLVRARKVVLACPLSCLRKVRFEPALPETFLRMSCRAGYGVVKKTHFVFEEPVGERRLTVTDTALGYLSSAAPNVLSSFAGGEEVLAGLGLPEEKRGREDVRTLRKLYDVGEPAEVVQKVWAEGLWSGGSYLILAPGDLAAFGRAMGSSFGDVHLAGAEAVVAAPSFMNSAVVAGKRAAEKVAEEVSGRKS